MTCPANRIQDRGLTFSGAAFGVTARIGSRPFENHILERQNVTQLTFFLILTMDAEAHRLLDA